MAISGGDGSIILTTKVDTSGISKGSLSIRSALQGVDNTVKKIQNSFSAFREQKATLATLNQAIKDQQYALNSLNLEYAEYVAKGKASSTEAKQLKSNIDALTVEMREMEGAAATLGAKGSASINRLGVAMRSLLSYFIGIQTIFKVINFSGEAAQFATQTEASVQRLSDIYGEASQVVGDFIDQNARAIGLSRASAASFASSYGNIFSAFSDQRTNAELTNEFLNLTAVIASKTGRTLEETQEKIKSGLFGNLRAIDDLGIFVRQTALESSEAFRKLAGDRSWDELSSEEQQQIRAYAIMEQGVQKYGNTVMETTALTRSQYQAAYEDFQNTWGQVVNTVLIPVLKILTQVFTIATKGLQVIAGLSGKTVENFNQEEEETDKTKKNIEKQRKEQEKLNKSLKKGLASFDEINTLSGQSTGNTDGSGDSNGGGNKNNYKNNYTEQISKDMTAIMGIVAEALIAVGLILLFTGHIGWGIGFIIAGAGLLAVTMASASEFGYDGIINMLTTIMGIAGGALLALGIILLWIGGVVGKPVAIGMIIAGAALIVGAVAAKAAFAPEDIKGWLSLIMGIAGGALLALGIILVMVGSVPLGVGMIIAGAVSLVSAFAINSNTIVELLKGPIGTIVMLVSTLTLVIGIILACTGAALPLAIGLIAVGAVGLASTVALNWNTIPEKITKFFQDNAWIMAGVSLALLVIGILLCFTPMLALGIGLIAEGAVGLAATVALNWNTIKEKVTNAFNAVVDWVKTWGLLVLGIILTLTGNPFLGIPLIVKGAKSLTEAQNPTWLAILDKLKEVWGKIKAFWNSYIAPIFTAKWWADLGKKAINGLLGVIEIGLNWIINKINEFIGGISGIVGAVGKVIGQDWSIGKIPNVKIPRLAQGAVIPPNREFLAVLGDQKHGTNIEAPLDTIVEAFNIALAQNNGARGVNTEVILEVDGREFGRAVVEQGNRENRRIGTRLVIA